MNSDTKEAVKADSIEAIGHLLEGFLWPVDKQRRKRERILAAATELFVRQGYKKTSVDEVARHAGIAKGTLYLYYRNKAELVFHAIALEELSYLDRLRQIVAASLTPKERLRSFLASWLIMAHEQPLIRSLAGGDHEMEIAIREIDTKVLAQVNEWQIEFTAGLLDQATDRCWPQVLLKERARVLINLMFAVLTSGPGMVEELPFDRHVSVVVDVIVDGILERGEGGHLFNIMEAGKHA